MITIVVVFLTVSVGLLLVQLIRSVMINSARKKSERELTRIESYSDNYQDVVEQNHRLRQLRHDLVKLKRLSNEAASAEKKEGTDVLSDVLLSEYARLAEENRIGFSYNKESEPELPEFVCSRILTNMLENALEACLRMPEEEKQQVVVRIEAKRICVENTKNRQEHPLENGFSTTKADKNLHGLGLTVIRDLTAEFGWEAKLADRKDWVITEVYKTEKPV